MSMGGGGKAPKSTEATTSTIPKFAEPYAMAMLGRAQQLMETGAKNGMPTYQGQRVAGFSPMQEQAFRGIAGMQTSPYLQQGAGMAGLAGLGGLQNNRWTDAGTMQSYMSPYMQGVVNVQKQQAMRDAALMNSNEQARLAASGAGMGGSRAAIQGAEAQRNLGLGLQDIQAKGLQSAYDQGFKAFDADEGRRLQGLGITGQAASTLAGIGGDQYNQQMGIYNAQQESGAKQQALQQQVLTQNYQDFLDQLNYPYKQMGFMSDLLRGLPTNESRNLYTAPGSTAGAAAGLLGGLGSLYLGGK